MDEQIAKKSAIYNELIRKKNEGTLTQYDVVDLKQEFQRCNHICNHIIRGYTNPAGKYIAVALFGSAGLGYWLSTRPAMGRLFTIKSSLLIVPSVLLPVIFAVEFSKRRLGDRKEAKRFTDMRDESYEIDDKFYEDLDNLKKDNLKYI
jgi:hypothetical protein